MQKQSSLSSSREGDFNSKKHVPSSSTARVKRSVPFLRQFVFLVHWERHAHPLHNSDRCHLEIDSSTCPFCVLCWPSAWLVKILLLQMIGQPKHGQQFLYFYFLFMLEVKLSGSSQISLSKWQGNLSFWFDIIFCIFFPMQVQVN